MVSVVLGRLRDPERAGVATRGPVTTHVPRELLLRRCSWNCESLNTCTGMLDQLLKFILKPLARFHEHSC